MFASPELMCQIVNQMQAEQRAIAERERLASAVLRIQRRQRLAQFYCGLAWRMIAYGTTILNRFGDDAVTLRKRWV